MRGRGVWAAAAAVAAADLAKARGNESAWTERGRDGGGAMEEERWRRREGSAARFLRHGPLR